MRARLLVVAVFLLAAAGCLTDEAADRSGDEVTPDDEEVGEQASEKPTVLLYEHDGTVEGSSPPDPTGPGSLADVEPARADTFEVPRNTSEVWFRSEILHGMGSGKVEVVGPDGEVVYGTQTYSYAGIPCEAATGVSTPQTAITGSELAPGTYEVRHYVAGTMCIEIRIGAVLGG